MRYEPGQEICRQGDPADSFFLIRIGFVKVTQAFPGGDSCCATSNRPGYFGEIGLLGEGVRTATCTALDHVEVVRIRSEDFHAMLHEFPDIQARLTEAVRVRLEADVKRRKTLVMPPLDDYLGQGLMEAQNLLLIDLERCTRCDDCVRACADAHEGVTRLVRDGLRFDKFLVATSCRSCRDPLCMVGCPVGSIRRHPDSLRDHHRGLVHRLRAVRHQVPVRQHQPAPVHGRGRGSRAARASARPCCGRRPPPAT